MEYPNPGVRIVSFGVQVQGRFRAHKLKGFLLQHAERVKQHAIDVAKQEGRPFQYLQEKVRKEELAKEIAARDQIRDGLICVFSVLEPCRTFSFRFEKGKPFVASARRKCLFLDLQMVWQIFKRPCRFSNVFSCKKIRR